MKFTSQNFFWPCEENKLKISQNKCKKNQQYYLYEIKKNASFLQIIKGIRLASKVYVKDTLITETEHSLKSRGYRLKSHKMSFSIISISKDPIFIKLCSWFTARYAFCLTIHLDYHQIARSWGVILHFERHVCHLVVTNKTKVAFSENIVSYKLFLYSFIERVT